MHGNETIIMEYKRSSFDEISTLFNEWFLDKLCSLFPNPNTFEATLLVIEIEFKGFVINWSS